MPNKAAGKILTSTDNHRNQVFSFYFLLVFLITINYVYLAASQKNTKMSMVKVVIKVAEEHQFMQMMQRGIVVETGGVFGFSCRRLPALLFFFVLGCKMPEYELCAPLHLGSSLILEKAGECIISLNSTSLLIALSRSKAEKQSLISFLGYCLIN